MAVCSDGSYGIAEGLIYSFPVRCSKGTYEIVKDFTTDDWLKQAMQISAKELMDEREEAQKVLSS